MEDFEDRKVDVIRSRTAQVPHKPGYIAEREIPGLAEYRRVEILVDALVDAAVDLGVLAVGIRPLPDRKDVGEVSAVPDGQGQAGLESGNAVDLPSAEDPVHHRRGRAKVLVALAEGELVDAAHDDTLRNVLRRDGPFRRAVVE